MIDVQCPSCSKAYRVSDDKAGKKLRCRECQAAVPIPVADEFDTDGFDDFGSDDFGSPASSGDAFDDAFSSAGSPQPRRRPPQRRKPAQSSGSKVGIIIAAVGGGIAVIAAIVVGIVFAVKASGDGEDKSKKSDDNLAGTPTIPGDSDPGGNGPGAGNFQKHERVANDVIAQMKVLRSAMQSVRGRNSARAAAVRINRVCDRLEQLAKDERGLPPLSFDEKRRLNDKMRRELAGINSQMRTIGFNAGRASQGEPSFVAAARRLQSVGQKLQGMGGL